jgi:hypothetical protein
MKAAREQGDPELEESGVVGANGAPAPPPVDKEKRYFHVLVNVFHICFLSLSHSPLNVFHSYFLIPSDQH